MPTTPDLSQILEENPEEVPERIKQRAERLFEVREAKNNNPWSWMT
jgi:deoxyadenosine/deoxycytidine kinase